MKTLIAVLAVFVAACNTNEKTSIFDPVFTPEYDRGNVPVVVVEVTERSDMNAKCQGDNVIRDKLGCAVLAGNTCTVVVYKGFADEQIPHGKKHCRYGKWHD